MGHPDEDLLECNYWRRRSIGDTDLVNGAEGLKRISHLMQLRASMRALVTVSETRLTIAFNRSRPVTPAGFEGVPPVTIRDRLRIVQRDYAGGGEGANTALGLVQGASVHGSIMLES
jgi:hypothetical protein